MKLHTHPMSNHAARVQIMFEELEIPYEPILNDLETQNQTPSFLALNPNAKVPVLDDDGYVLWESHAIMRYLCDKNKKTSWYPSDCKERAQIDKWLDWAHTRINPEAIIINFNNVVLGENGDQLKIQEAKSNLEAILPILNDALEDNEYLCGNISIADMSVFTSVVYLEQNHVDIEKYPNIKRWYDKIKQRKSVTKVL